MSTPEQTQRSWARELLRGRMDGLRFVGPQPTASGGAVALNFGRRDYVLRRFLALSDVAGILIAFGLMAALSSTKQSGASALWGILVVPVWLAVLASYGLYNRDIKRISHSTVDDVPWLLHAVLVACLLTWLYYNALPIAKLEFLDVLLLGVIATGAILLLRSIARRITGRRLQPERVLFIGDGESTTALIRKIEAHPEYRLEPVGVIAGTGHFNDALIEHEPERIVLGETDLDEEALVTMLHRCKELSLKVSLLPQLFSALGPSVEVDDVEGVTVLGINPPVLPRSSRYMKRGLDLAGSLVVVLVTLPVIAMIALAIKLDSGGPVFFRQRRVGRGGKPFMLVKFRTMVVGAEQQIEELHEQSEDSNWLKLAHDPRITRVGRFLRLTSLDELPQFWNILKGDMSMVGPRPLIESEDSQVGGWGRSRLELTPGLTGLWQVLGRTNIPFEEMIKLDYLYVTNWSLWSDIRLILKTLPAVVTRRGAN